MYLILIALEYYHRNMYMFNAKITFFLKQNAELGGIPHYEHDENLFLDRREQMHYNVEDRTRIESKYPHMDRATLLRPNFHHETSKYQSELMFRRDEDYVESV